MPVTDVEIEVHRQRRATIVKSLNRHYQQMVKLRAKIDELENAQRRLDRCEVELFKRFNATRRKCGSGDLAPSASV
jgi:uncharacterized membrane-anchored protein YhcB (DUF1043 family)